MQFRTLFRVVFNELCKSVFSHKYPAFEEAHKNYLAHSEQLFNKSFKIRDIFEQLEYKNSLLEEYVLFARQLSPNNEVYLHEVICESSLYFYGSAILVKIFLLDRVKDCIAYDCGDVELELEIVLSLSKSFIKPLPHNLCECAEKSPVYFLDSLIVGDGKLWLENCCKHFFSVTQPSHMLNEVIKTIKNNLDKIENGGMPSTETTAMHV